LIERFGKPVTMQTADGAAVVEQVKPEPQGRWPKGVSGNPKGAAVDRVADRAGELFQAMSAELGALSPIDHALLKQACLLLARSERLKRARDADAAVRLSSEARRILASLRKHAAPKAPGQSPLQQYLASLPAETEPSEALE
jgi:hypothetical protein